MDSKQTFSLIGVNVELVLNESYSHGSKWMPVYTVYVQTVDEYKAYMKFTITTIFHDCSSGWCGAYTGECSDPEHVERIRQLHYIPLSEYIVSLIRYNSDKKCMSKYWDVTRIVTSDGVVVFNISRNGGEVVINDEGNEESCDGDSYYPMGSVTFNEDLFNKTCRLLEVKHPPKITSADTSEFFTHDIVGKPSSDIMTMLGHGRSGARSDIKRQVYVFYGPSCTGKSFLSSKFFRLRVYETDQEAELPDNLIDHSVIVVGNRHPGQLLLVKTTLAGCGDSVEVIWINFSRECPV
jgi:hypothetical protein